MNWVNNNLDIIANYAMAHLILALPAIAISLVLAIPIAWLALRVRRLRTLLVSGSSLLYAIPSLPLFIILPVILVPASATRSMWWWRSVSMASR